MVSEKSGPDYFWLLHEVERLRSENEMLRKERDRIWEEANHAFQVERKLKDLLKLMQPEPMVASSGV